MSVVDGVVEKAKWYVKYRTTIWGIVWFLVGLFGGNVDRAKDYVPTLKYSDKQVEQKVEELEFYQEKVQEISKELDKLRSE